MPTRFVLLMALLLPPSATLAQQLPPAQEQALARLRLSIEVTEHASAVANYNTGVAEASSWRRWTAREGVRPILEEEFFDRLGMATEAAKARAYRQRWQRRYRIGLVMSGSGLALLTAGLISDGGGVTAAGGGLMMAGLFPLAFGASDARKNWAPFSAVAPLVPTYNAQLRERIVRGELR